MKMSSKFTRCITHLLRVGTKDQPFHKLHYTTAPGPKSLQVKPALIQSRCLSTPANSLPLLRRTLKSPIFTQTASILTEVDVSKIPKEHPEKGRLVYVGTLANMVKFVKAFSVSTSIVGICLQPYLYMSTSEQPLMLTVAMGSMLSFFIFLTPLILHFITKRYVTQLYYDDATGKFTATNYTFFVREKDTKFGAADVSLPEVPGLFTTVKVGDTPIFLDASLFLDREAYVRLMGYDKPIDWKMPSFDDKKRE